MPSLTRLTTGGVLNPLKNTTKIGHNKLLHQEPLQPPLEPRERWLGGQTTGRGRAVGCGQTRCCRVWAGAPTLGIVGLRADRGRDASDARDSSKARDASKARDVSDARDARDASKARHARDTNKARHASKARHAQDASDARDASKARHASNASSAAGVRR